MKRHIVLLGALLSSVMVLSQVGINTDTPKSTLDVVGKAADATTLDGITAPRLTGTQLRAKTYTTAQTGALIYVTAADSAPAGQTVNVIATGYYFFDGVKWINAGSGNYKNIYNADDAFTANRTATIPSGQWLNFAGTGNVGIGGVDPIAKLNVNGFIQFGPVDSNYGVGRIVNDNTGEKYGLTQSTYFPATGDASSPGARIYTSGAVTKGHISFGSYSSPTAYTEWGRFSQSRGNFGINTINGTGSNNPTEKLDVNGNVRIRTLPLNGSTNAHFTNVDGTISTSQSQTFLATRTVVADANGILGTVVGLPSLLNIYNNDGSLTGGRTLTNNGFNLTFLGTNQSTVFQSGGGIRQYGKAGIKRADIVLTANDNNGDGVSSNLQIFQDPEQLGQITVSGDSRGLVIGSTSTTLAAPIQFATSVGGGATGTEKMRITPTGNVGINTSTPNAGTRFHIVKTASDLTPAIIEGCSTYGDNNAAITAGLPVGALYRKADGTLMVRY